MRFSVGALLIAAVLALSIEARAAAPPAPNAKAALTASYVATGPVTDESLARLRELLEKLPGVEQVEVRRLGSSAAVRIRGDQLMSLFAAAARKVGLQMRPAPIRSFAAAGPVSDAGRARLRELLEKVGGVDRVDLGPDNAGAAVRITGVAAGNEITAAGKEAGYTVRQLGSYVVAGPTGQADLAKLRAALVRTSGVEKLELQGLIGGATLLIYGDVNDSMLVASARGAGFALWPLGTVEKSKEYRLGGPNTADPQKLRETLRGVEGIGEVEIESDAEGSRLVITGGLARQDKLAAAAGEAGFTLTPIETVALPTLVPQPGRNTPPDFDERVLEEQAKTGEPAPDFTLLSKDGSSMLSLSEYRGKKPVVLMFGSCT